MEKEEKKKKVLDEYSGGQVNLHYTKVRLTTFVEEFIKNFRRIQGTDKKRVIKETFFVLIIAGILTSFFYLVFLFMGLIV